MTFISFRKVVASLALTSTLLFAFSSCDEDDTWPTSGVADEHEYVDLGLSVLWATTNVGADVAQASGSHVAWGEVSTKAVYDWDSYTLGLPDQISKYAGADGRQALEAADDFASTSWGGAWRTPTEQEWVELFHDCDCEWVRLNNQDGMKIIGSNGNWIFLPVTGYYSESQLSARMSFAYYWTANKDVDEDQARAIRLHNFSLDVISFCRAYGVCVRPVRSK